jgi:hypothetical protein
MGIIDHGGQWYPGRHPAIVDRELWERVQSVRVARSIADERARKYNHYLKGTLFCGECGRRLVIARALGRGGEYLYYFCTGRKVGKCHLPYVRVEAIEAEVPEQYHGVRLPADREQEFKEVLGWSLVELETRRTATLDRLNRGRVAVRARKDRILDLAGDDDLPRVSLWPGSCSPTRCRPTRMATT